MNLAVIVAAAVVGAGSGALLPRPAYRLSVPKSLAPAVGCPHCRTTPPAGIRGWIGGSRCPTCRKPLTASTWFYTTASASTFALLAWALPHRHPAQMALLAAWLVFTATGTLLSAVDIHAKRLPTTIIAPTAAVVGALVIAAAISANQPAIARNAGVAAAVIALAYTGVALLGPGKLGMGDVRLAALTGLLLGTNSWGAVLLGATLPYLLAAIAATALLLTRRARRGAEIPFGPYLVAGALLAQVMAGGAGHQ